MNFRPQNDISHIRVYGHVKLITSAAHHTTARTAAGSQFESMATPVYAPSRPLSFLCPPPLSKCVLFAFRARSPPLNALTTTTNLTDNCAHLKPPPPHHSNNAGCWLYAFDAGVLLVGRPQRRGAHTKHLHKDIKTRVIVRRARRNTLARGWFGVVVVVGADCDVD